MRDAALPSGVAGMQNWSVLLLGNGVSAVERRALGLEKLPNVTNKMEAEAIAVHAQAPYCVCLMRHGQKALAIRDTPCNVQRLDLSIYQASTKRGLEVFHSPTTLVKVVLRGGHAAAVLRQWVCIGG